MHGLFSGQKMSHKNGGHLHKTIFHLYIYIYIYIRLKTDEDIILISTVIDWNKSKAPIDRHKKSSVINVHYNNEECDFKRADEQK